MNRRHDGERERSAFVRAGALVASSTLLLTAIFVGVLSLVSGGAVGIENRLPAYVLVLAVTFVAGLVVVEQGPRRQARDAIGVAAGVALAVFVAVALAGEGVLYAYSTPAAVFSSRSFLYFVAAALIGTGVGYWGIAHRRELSRPARGRL